MPTAEASIKTEHAARYLARLCGHLGKMGAAGHRLGHRRPSHAPVRAVRPSRNPGRSRSKGKVVPQRNRHDHLSRAGATLDRVRLNEAVTHIAFGGRRRRVYARITALSGAIPETGSWTSAAA